MGGICFKAKTETESRLEKAIAKKRADHEALVQAAKEGKVVGKQHAPLTLESIIMRFIKVKHATVLMKETFTANAGADGTLNFEGLVNAMKILHGSMTQKDVQHLFDFVDLDASLSISMKEFLVALAVGHCLDLVPAIEDRSHPRSGSTVVPAEQMQVVVVSAENKKIAKEIAEMLDLVVTAWILFDKKGKGYIEKSAIIAVMGDTGGTGRVAKGTVPTGGASALGDEKMKEMDIDNGGTVDFAEFVFSFAGWVAVDEADGVEGGSTK